MYMETGKYMIFAFHRDNYYEVRLDEEGRFIEILQGNGVALTRCGRKNKLKIIFSMKESDSGLYEKFIEALNKEDFLYHEIMNK